MIRWSCRSLGLTFTVSFVLALPLAAQQNQPATTEGDFTVKNFKFRSGESLPELRLHYTMTEMVADGAVTHEERSRMVIAAYPRRKRDLLAPFAANGEFQQLTVESCEMFELPDFAWTDYQRDGDKEALSSKHALFFRSIFVPSLASALVRVRAGDSEALATFSNQIEQRLKRRLAGQPTPMHSFVQSIVLAKVKER